MILQVLIAMIAGWINRHQQQVIVYLLEENRTLHAKLPGGCVRWRLRRFLPLYRALGVSRNDDSYHQSRPWS